MKSTLLSGLVLALGGALGCHAAEPVFQPWQLEELHGTDGFSLRVPQFEVPAGHESQNCYFVRVPDNAAGKDLWIERVVTAINPGSHHVNVFRVKSIIKLDPAQGTPMMLGDFAATVIEGGDDYAHNPCWDSANWADWPLVANSQESSPGQNTTDWQLPAGVAIRMQPGEMLMLQTHYVNTSDQPTKYGAKVGINFYNRKDPTPAVEMGSLFATQQNIRICASQPRQTYSGTCRFPGQVTIAAANGHFHKRGQRFSIYTWDGASIDHPAEQTKFYESLNWNEPPMMTDLDVPAAARTGVWWDCQYQWQKPTFFSCDDVNAKDPLHQNDCCYTFGGITDVGEHCNVFLYYYPKVESDVFCL